MIAYWQCVQMCVYVTYGHKKTCQMLCYACTSKCNIVDITTQEERKKDEEREIVADELN